MIMLNISKSRLASLLFFCYSKKNIHYKFDIKKKRELNLCLGLATYYLWNLGGGYITFQDLTFIICRMERIAIDVMKIQLDNKNLSYSVFYIKEFLDLGVM